MRIFLGFPFVGLEKMFFQERSAESFRANAAEEF